MKLVLVESPNKCETIKRYLGENYRVMATNGHLRDLAISGKEGLGVDCENDFKPTYASIRGKKKIINDIKAAAKKSDEVIIATDPDREGEAIAAELFTILNLNKDNKRLEFHEITRNSINEAINNPRVIDFNLVASQEARRIIDRILGFKLSNLVQRKNNLKSAGRVQSATLKLIVDHEREIKAFKPEEYWTLIAKLNGDNAHIEAPIYKYKDKEVKLTSGDQVNEIKQATGNELTILDINKSIRTIEPKAPFKTSTLQQEAISRFGLSASKVTRILQDLYEGIEVNGEHVGLITYIRTDSTYLSDTYVNRAKAYIKERYGEEYIGPNRIVKAKDKSEFAQNAHEAIRPTSNHRTPASLRATLKSNPKFTNNHFKVYELIYNHTLAFLMPGKKEETTAVIIGNKDVSYKITGNKTIYPGYEVLGYKSENKILGFEPNVGDKFKVDDLLSEQKFTQPPAHYTEAKIIKLMEEKGIGRPSTYSSTITTLINRTYVAKEKGALIPTESGMRVVEFLESKFPNVVDSSYTAALEEELDKVAEASTTRTDAINIFYNPFMKIWVVAMRERLGNCPKCGAPLKRVKGRYGTFVGCSNYPTCDYKEVKEKAKPVEVGRNCPECGAPLIKRVSKKGKTFIACSRFPDCKYTESKNRNSNKKVEIIKKCPECGGNLVVRKGYDKVKKCAKFFLGCSNYPKCHHIEDYNPENKDNN